MSRLTAHAVIVFLIGCSGPAGQDVGSSPDSATAPAIPAEIAFTSRANGHVGIYLWSNGETKLLTPEFQVAEAPDWAPNGKRIAFQAKVNDNYDVYILDIESGKTTRLTRHEATDQHPAWSPDGSTIAFMSDRGNEELRFDVHLMNADGKNVRRFTHAVDGTEFPAWSPDGELIAFTAPSRPGGGRVRRDATDIQPRNVFSAIFVGRKDGTQIRKVTDGDAIVLSPAWSPDGSEIAFCSTRVSDPASSRHMAIYVVRADGSNIRRVTGFEAQNLCPSWSPHPTKVLFHSTRSEHPEEPWKETAELYTVNSHGMELTRLTNNATDDFFPDWRPAQSHRPK